MRGVRNTDPWTSWVASLEDRHDLVMRDVVWSALRNFGPMTHDQLIEAVNRVRPASPSGVRSRCAELVELGFVEQHPTLHAKSRYGRVSLLWQVVRP
jgi:hypothetical protein